mmetsp:Transcript_52691/g.105798  ORF Transcript_52691/g.105798 Transcript_52691/m.105798 type:complete len:195 (+) Transcript_52691:65-649(+)
MRNLALLGPSTAMYASSPCRAKRRHSIAGASLLLLCFGLAAERVLAFAGAACAERSRSQARTGLLRGAGGRAGLVCRLAAPAIIPASDPSALGAKTLITSAPWQGKEVIIGALLLFAAVLGIFLVLNVSRLFFSDEFDYTPEELEAQKRGGKIGGGTGPGPKKIPEKMTPEKYKALKAASEAGRTKESSRPRLR